MARNPHQLEVGTGWVRAEKDPDRTGGMEDKSAIRTDALTGSRDAPCMDAAPGAQSRLNLTYFDARGARLQIGQSGRLLRPRMLARPPPRGMAPGQLLIAAWSIYGTRALGSPGTSTAARSSFVWIAVSFGSGSGPTTCRGGTAQRR